MNMVIHAVFISNLFIRNKVKTTWISIMQRESSFVFKWLVSCVWVSVVCFVYIEFILWFVLFMITTPSLYYPPFPSLPFSLLLHFPLLLPLPLPHPSSLLPLLSCSTLLWYFFLACNSVISNPLVYKVFNNLVYISSCLSLCSVLCTWINTHKMHI